MIDIKNFDDLVDIEDAMIDFVGDWFLAIKGTKRKGWRAIAVRVPTLVLWLVVVTALTLSLLVRVLLVGIPLLLITPFILRKKKTLKQEDRGPLYD
jgi:hypothetical protein